jgi:Domain of unknown function (DUF1707)
MSAPSSPSWIHAATRRRASYADLRMSDAERTEVADLLAKHYGDGRLDEAEFNERLDRAMKAKTYSDLSGLFADLPRTEAADASGVSKAAAGHQRHQHRGQRGLFLLLVIVLAVGAGHVLVWSVTPWVWIALLGLAVLYASRIGRRMS